MTYKERENRLITEMENRTAYNDGLTIPELCKRVLGYEMQVLYDKNIQKAWRKIHKRWSAPDANGKYYLDCSLTPEDITAIGGEDYNDKQYEDLNRLKQIKKMIYRTRMKYRSGTKHNDTTMHKHQYFLVPPRLQQADRMWRCVHIIAGENDHLLDSLSMRHEQVLGGLHKQIKKLEALKNLTDEQFQELQDQARDRILGENELIQSGVDIKKWVEDKE